MSHENAPIPTDELIKPSDVERVMAKLSRPCRHAYELAGEEATRAGSSYIGATHLLIGLAESGKTAAARLFQSLSLTAEEVRARLGFVEGATPETASNGSPPPLSPRARRMLLAAERELGKHGSGEIGTLHLLHALIAEREGVAVFVLEEPGTGLERLGAALQKAFREQWDDEGMATRD